MTLSATEKLQELIDKFSGADRILVLLNADPDAIASAMAFERLMRRRTTLINLSNINTITRPDNMAMIRLFDLTLIHITKIDPHTYNKVVLLDSQPGHSDIFSEFDFTVVIDHHPDTGYRAPFTDIRPDYGATSSIMTEYLKTAKIKPSEELATALLHGIKTDTKNFERMATNADIRAFQYLYRLANVHLARRIEQVDLRMNFLDYFRKAIEEKIILDSHVYAHLGTVENPDICVLIADFFMRVNTVTWSIVSGIFEDKLIIIFRNDGLHRDAGKLAARLFSGIGSAGGHRSMARAEIPMENIRDLVPDTEKEQIRKWVIEKIDEVLSNGRHQP